MGIVREGNILLKAGRALSALKRTYANLILQELITRKELTEFMDSKLSRQDGPFQPFSAPFPHGIRSSNLVRRGPPFRAVNYPISNILSCQNISAHLHYLQGLLRGNYM